MPYSHTPVYVPVDSSSVSMGVNNTINDGCIDGATKDIIIHPCYGKVNSGVTLSDNNLAISFSSSNNTCAMGDFGLSSGKYYWEVRITGAAGSSGCYVAVVTMDRALGVISNQIGDSSSDTKGWAYKGLNGQKGNGGSSSSYGNSSTDIWVGGTVIGVALDLDNNAIWFAKNGSWVDGNGTDNSATVLAEIEAGTTSSAAFTNSDNSFGSTPLTWAYAANNTAWESKTCFTSSSWKYTAPSGFEQVTLTRTGIGNLATWNSNSKTGGTLSEGNTKFAVSGDQSCLSTHFAHTSGKYFAEATLSRGDTVFFGVKPSNAQTITTAGAPGAYSEQHNLYFAYFKIDNLGGAIFSPETADRIADQGAGDSRYSVSSGDTVGCLLNLDDYNVRWYKLTDGAWVQLQKTGAANATVALYPTGQSWTFMARGITDNNGGDIVDANFGQRPFSATPPENAVPLSTQNLPAPTVTPSEFFQVLDHTHDGSSTTFTLNWDPTVHDTMLMFKDQDDNSTPWYYSQTLHLGLQYPKRLPNISGGTNYMIAGNSQDTNLLSVSGTTITLGSTLPASDYAIYCWRFGKISDRASNSAGGGIDVASTSSVASHGGAGLCHYVGVSGASNSVAKVITHGMGSSGINWFVHENWQAANSPIYLHFERQHTDGTDRRDRYSMYTNNGNAANDQLGYLFGGGSWPTGATLSCGSQLITDGASQNQVLWMFNEVAGFIKIGVYKGTGSTSGQNVNTGFAPALIIIRRSDSANGWVLRDNLRSPRNPSDENLGWHQDSAEDASGGDIDFLANGFRPVENEATVNASGGVYEYIAFASQPFGGAGVPQSKAK